MYTVQMLANLSVKVEAGSTLTPDLSRSRPSDALVSNWSDEIPTAFDITSPLTPVSLQEASVTPGTAALLAERRKHQANDAKCHMLGWKCTPLAVESYGSWGSEARQVFSHLALRLSFGVGILKPKILVKIYGKLNIALVSILAPPTSVFNTARGTTSLCHHKGIQFELEVRTVEMEKWAWMMGHHSTLS
ncbi:hypothetical protein EMCRGX_G023036 [Ephydatia muelleri]